MNWDFISQKTSVFIATAVKTSNLSYIFVFESVVPHAADLPNLQPNIEIPVVLSGEFNVDITQRMPFYLPRV
jgi:hypothetical protein